MLFLVCLFIPLIVCVASFSVFLSIQVPLFIGSEDTTNTSFVGANTTVQLGCFSLSNTKEVTVTPSNGNMDRLVIHRIAEDAIGTQPVVLPYAKLTPDDNGYIYRNSGQIYMNYYGNSNPLFTAGPANITYWIKLVTYANNSPCPLQLLVFTFTFSS